MEERAARVRKATSRNDNNRPRQRQTKGGGPASDDKRYRHANGRLSRWDITTPNHRAPAYESDPGRCRPSLSLRGVGEHGHATGGRPLAHRHHKRRGLFSQAALATRTGQRDHSDNCVGADVRVGHRRHIAEGRVSVPALWLSAVASNAIPTVACCGTLRDHRCRRLAGRLSGPSDRPRNPPGRVARFTG